MSGIQMHILTFFSGITVGATLASIAWQWALRNEK